MHHPSQFTPSKLWILGLALFGSQSFAHAEDLDSPDTLHLNVISSNTTPTRPTGLDINTFLGADRFYNNGYTGTNATVANIEGQAIWNGHQTLTQVNTYIYGTGAVTSVGSHPTSVSQAIAGRPAGNTLQSGIAPNATLWSGSIATSVNGNNFNITNASVASVYTPILKTGVGANLLTADVFNSSWGGASKTGHDSLTMGIDGLLYQTGKVGVVAAGNDGPSTNSVTGPAAGYNTISVAALGADTGSNIYNQVSSFSSRSPTDFYNPNNGLTYSGLRARVDIAAPGQNLTLANSSGASAYSSNSAGTSFAAPLVAGGAALVVDAGKDLYASNPEAIDGRVVKAVLLNAADKTVGWNNGQTTVGGVIQTTQSLDYSVGTGRMNLSQTYDQYVDIGDGGKAGTTDLAGTGCHIAGNCLMGDVSKVGWDFGWANKDATNLYYIDQQLGQGQHFTATLDWFADINPGSDASFTGTAYNHLADLDLYIFQYDPLTHAIISTIAESVSTLNIVEHLYFSLASSGYYGIAVDYSGDIFNFNNATGEYYGLAWSVVPEPSSILLFVAGSATVVTRRLKKAC